MKRELIAFALGCTVVATVAYVAWGRDARAVATEVAELQQQVTSIREVLSGYTKYSDYLTAGKKQMAEQAIFLAARVRRNETVTRKLEKSWFGLKSNAVVEVAYDVEYSFGYDLRAAGYEVVTTDAGIEMRLSRPSLVARPAVAKLKHEILSGGVLTDEDAAVRELYEGASERAASQGRTMASDEAIVALCEKSLVAFLRDLLLKQPGVKYVPTIKVVYKTPPS